MSGKTDKILKEYALIVGQKFADVKKRYRITNKHERQTVMENMKAHIRLYWSTRRAK